MSGPSTSPSIIDLSPIFRSWLTENKPFRTIQATTAPIRSQVGVVVMSFWTRSILAAGIACAAFAPTQASAGVGDLLVAPTRIVLDGRKGAEIILNNIGEEPATYRVSVEFWRMTDRGEFF